MEKLTIDFLKEIGFRYSTQSNLIGSISVGGYNGKLSQGECHALLIQSIATFLIDEQLKYFLQHELLKLTKQDVKEIFNWNRPDISTHLSAIIKLLYDPFINWSIPQIHFIFLYMWRIYCISRKGNVGIDTVNIVSFLNIRIKKPETRKKIALALMELDYLDYFNLESEKKKLFDVALGV